MMARLNRLTMHAITQTSKRNGARICQLLAADNAQFARLYHSTSPKQAIAYQAESARLYAHARGMMGVE